MLSQVAPGMKIFADLAPGCPSEAARAIKWVASSTEWAAALVSAEAIEALRNKMAKKVRKDLFTECVAASAFAEAGLPMIKTAKNLDRARKQVAVIERWVKNTTRR